MTIAKLDSYDIGIINALQTNGRASINDLAEQVNLSPSPVARRLRILEEDGIITGYAALIDEAALGYEFSVFVSVKLDRQVDDALAQFEAAVRSFPEVVDCWLMTGNRDYLLRIATRGPADFERFLTGSFTKVPGVASIESSIPLRRVKAGLSRTLDR
ncbi:MULTISPECIES: Lrp/AsnC family transcriptional regulator [Rhodobacterales]|uniref:Lrp/AsnC family transcriptional regulator n=1 Tax=Roseobacter sp. N2S TaxID=2663844 RepID=UPI0028588E8B|nr:MULTISPECIES: Lrp/AsnC family transcriptional regulator [Rhodobacterales]MDR6266875.1 Lrp/AsnC family leucine-responsive transcriptional regulator [Roseobacter sp. N2S]